MPPSLPLLKHDAGKLLAKLVCHMIFATCHGKPCQFATATSCRYLHSHPFTLPTLAATYKDTYRCGILSTDPDIHSHHADPATHESQQPVLTHQSSVGWPVTGQHALVPPASHTPSHTSALLARLSLAQPCTGPTSQLTPATPSGWRCLAS